jgi:hypothetical protein
MNAEMLLLAVLAAMTMVALMIAINSRGRWRATLSSLMAVCMLGGTVWVFTLHISMMEDSGREGGGFELLERLQGREQARDKKERAATTATMLALITDASEFAGSLTRQRMHDPQYSHEQLVARANGAQTRFDTINGEIGESRHLFEHFPAAAKLLHEAMDELKAASHFFRAYYFAENSEAEVSTERLMKQRARNAQETLARAKRAVDGEGRH